MIDSQEISGRVPVPTVHVALPSNRKLRVLTLQLECLGFLTLTARRKYPNRIPIFEAQVLENMLSGLAVAPSVIFVARNNYQWEFRALVGDLASGNFFHHFSQSNEASDLWLAESYGKTVLIALEVTISRLCKANRWIRKMEQWSQLPYNDVHRPETPEQLHCRERSPGNRLSHHQEGHNGWHANESDVQLRVPLARSRRTLDV